MFKIIFNTLILTIEIRCWFMYEFWILSLKVEFLYRKLIEWSAIKSNYKRQSYHQYRLHWLESVCCYCLVAYPTLLRKVTKLLRSTNTNWFHFWKLYTIVYRKAFFILLLRNLIAKVTINYHLHSINHKS